MQLLVIVVVVATAAASRQPLSVGSAVDHAEACWLAVTAILWLIQAWCVGRVLSAWRDDRLAGHPLRRADFVTRHYPLVWLSLNLIVVRGLQVDQGVSSSWPTAPFAFVSSWAWCVNFFPLGLAWLTEYELVAGHSRLGYWQLRPDHPPSAPEMPLTRWHYLRQRLGCYVAPALLPAWGVLAIGELHPEKGAPPSLFVGMLTASALLIVWCGLPWLLKWGWRCRPIPDHALAQQIEGWCRSMGVPIRAVCLWPTSGELVNAVVCGTLPGTRMIFLSDGLLARLSTEQLQDVIAHELAHIRKHHSLRNIVMVLIPLLWVVGTQPDNSTSMVPAGVLVATIAMLLAVRGRVTEHQADWGAIFLLQRIAPAVEIPERVARYQATLQALHGWDGEREAWHWLHPCLAARCRFLASLADQPARRGWVLWTQELGTWGLAGLLGGLLRATLAII